MDIDAYLKECVTIDSMAIQTEFERTPSDFAYWSNRYAEVYRHYILAKQSREHIEATLQIEIRDQAEIGRGSGKMTVGEVEARIQKSPDYIDAKLKEAEADAERVRLLGVVEAMRTKREMLISLGAHMRAEMAGEIAVNGVPSRYSQSPSSRIEAQVAEARRES
jgi:hypothetical protein